MRKKINKSIGSSLDDFLKKEGIYEEASEEANQKLFKFLARNPKVRGMHTSEEVPIKVFSEQGELLAVFLEIREATSYVKDVHKGERNKPECYTEKIFMYLAPLNEVQVIVFSEK